MDEKSAIFEIIVASRNLDTNDSEAVKKLAKKCWDVSEFGETEFGCRFIKRLSEIFKGKSNDQCILCGQHKADNRIVCEVCYDNLQDQVKDYKSLIKTDKETMEQGSSDRTESLLASGDIISLKNDIKEQMHRQSVVSGRYTENLIRNLDASMDRLASRKSVRTNNRMLTTVLVISLVNTIGIIAIILMMFK